MTPATDLLTDEELGIEPDGIEPAADAIEPEPEPDALLVPGKPTTEADVAESSTDLVTRAKGFAIDSPEAFEQAGHLIEALKSFAREVEDFWKPDIERAHATWKGLTTKRASYLDPLKEAITVLSSRYATFARDEKARAARVRREQEEALRKQEQARIEAEAKAQQAEAARLRAEAKDVDSRDERIYLEDEARQAETAAQELSAAAKVVEAPVLPPAPALKAPKGVSVRSNWTFEVTDPMALVRAVAAGTVPANAVIPCETYLRARAKADKNSVTIPGVRFYDAGSVSSRRAR
jgi:hypothetical protein